MATRSKQQNPRARKVRIAALERSALRQIEIAGRAVKRGSEFSRRADALKPPEPQPESRFHVDLPDLSKALEKVEKPRNALAQSGDAMSTVHMARLVTDFLEATEYSEASPSNEDTEWGRQLILQMVCGALTYAEELDTAEREYRRSRREAAEALGGAS